MNRMRAACLFVPVLLGGPVSRAATYCVDSADGDDRPIGTIELD